MESVNVFGEPLQECGTDPVTGFFRDGCCTISDDAIGSHHTICAVMTAEFLAHQRGIGNDLITPNPAFGFTGLKPGDRWCVVALRWYQSYRAGCASPVVLASTNRKALEIVPLDILRTFAVDVPDDLSGLASD